MPSFFDEKATNELIAIIRQRRNEIFGMGPTRQHSTLRVIPAHYHCKVTRPITASMGSTPGCGEGLIERYDTGLDRMVTVFGKPQLVRNLGNIPIRELARIPVHIDPWGDFWADVAPSMMIQFVVAGVSQDGISVGILEVSHGPGDIPEVPDASESSGTCSEGNQPAVDNDGLVIVRDTMGCLQVEPGMIGWAHWVRDYGVPMEDPDGYWSIVSLCCP